MYKFVFDANFVFQPDERLSFQAEVSQVIGKLLSVWESDRKFGKAMAVKQATQALT